MYKDQHFFCVKFHHIAKFEKKCCKLNDFFSQKIKKLRKSFKISTFVYMVQVDSQKHTSMLKF